jgi:hypothetical protein
MAQGINAKARVRRSTKSPYFGHGELTARVFDALRAAETITSADIAAQAMRNEGLDPGSDPTTRTDFIRRVGLQLNDLQRKGKIERIEKGSSLRWRLTSEA